MLVNLSGLTNSRIRDLESMVVNLSGLTNSRIRDLESMVVNLLGLIDLEQIVFLDRVILQLK